MSGLLRLEMNLSVLTVNSRRARLERLLLVRQEWIIVRPVLRLREICATYLEVRVERAKTAESRLPERRQRLWIEEV